MSPRLDRWQHLELASFEFPPEAKREGPLGKLFQVRLPCVAPRKWVFEGTLWRYSGQAVTNPFWGSLPGFAQHGFYPRLQTWNWGRWGFRLIPRLVQNAGILGV